MYVLTINDIGKLADREESHEAERKRDQLVHEREIAQEKHYHEGHVRILEERVKVLEASRQETSVV